jgi:hypothetical protein
MQVIEKIKEWYRGRYVPRSNDPHSSLVFVGGRYEQPILARALGTIGRFWLAHWKWIGATIIVPLAVAVFHWLMR